MEDPSMYDFETLAVHGGCHPDPLTGALSPPIYQTSTFVFENAEQGARRFRGEEDGYIYTRISNPTTDMLAKKVAILEGAEAGQVCSTGLGATLVTIMSLASKGDHIISDPVIYGGTFAQFMHHLPCFGVDVTFVDTANIDEVSAAIKPNTKLIWTETPANPTLKVVDIKALCDFAKKKKLPVIVDNTFATPALQRPIELGAALVLHSATKYIGGHGDVVAGIVVGPQDMITKIRETTSHLGISLSPFDAWLLLRGLKTLAIRMKKHCENAQSIAEYLVKHPKVEIVRYPGLKSDPNYKIAMKQMSGFGGMISFDVKGGREAGKIIMDNVKVCTLAVSLGDVDTLIEHPASMTHSTLSPEEMVKAHITKGMIRLSVGIESARDLIADLDYTLGLV